MIMRRTLVIAALVLGFATPALAQMKEGTYSGSYTGYGTYKVTPVGKERILSASDENGLSVTDGFLDHVTWHCWGLGDRANGVVQSHGYCIATDVSGDQLVLDYDSGKRTPDQKSWKGSGKFTSGTGKFAGISGDLTFVTHGADFRSGADGTYFTYNTFEGHYKLAAAEATGSTTPPSTTPSK
jgi:hypothetical protein